MDIVEIKRLAEESKEVPYSAVEVLINDLNARPIVPIDVTEILRYKKQYEEFTKEPFSSVPSFFVERLIEAYETEKEPLNIEFDIYEKIYLDDAPNGIFGDLDEANVKLDVTVSNKDNKILIEGHLIVDIKYNQVSHQHFVPVSIEIPSSRITNMEAIQALIKQYDVSVLGSRAILLTGVLLVSEHALAVVEKKQNEQGISGLISRYRSDVVRMEQEINKGKEKIRKKYSKKTSDYVTFLTTRKIVVEELLLELEKLA